MYQVFALISYQLKSLIAGYTNAFGGGVCKLIWGSLVMARGKIFIVCEIQAKACCEANTLEKNSIESWNR